MQPVPTHLQARRSDQTLEILWSDIHESCYGFVELRAACQCAACVDEITHERLLDPAAIPPDLQLDDVQLVGNYAVRLCWSDGHSSGLYTWTLLREICPCTICRSSPRSKAPASPPHND